MSEAQDKFYWRLWSALRKAVPDADRHAVHRQLGLPESHTAWRNEHFDRWKGHCLAKAQPANFRAQIQQVKMPEIRKQVFIDHILTALGEGEEYAESILARMNRRRKLGNKFATMDTLDEAGLQAVMIALKKECRRRWPTKECLLGEIALARVEGIDESYAQAEVLKALNWRSLGRGLEYMYYEPLLVVLATLRRLGGAVAPAGLYCDGPQGFILGEAVEVDQPF